MSTNLERILAKDRRTEEESKVDASLLELFQQSPIPPDQLLRNLGLFIDRIAWADYLFMIELYRMALDVHGVIAEFGVKWGKNLSLFTALRGVFEPFNHTRKIIGFDTFSGLAGVHDKDGSSQSVHQAAFAVSAGYEKTLERVLELHEAKSPIPQIKKFELVKGDVRETLDAYLKRHPETIFALVYFDMDIYEPTKYCLERIRPHLTKGSIIGFDELCNPKFPGETIALAEVLTLDWAPIRRMPFSPSTAYIIVDQ